MIRDVSVLVAFSSRRIFKSSFKIKGTNGSVDIHFEYLED